MNLSSFAAALRRTGIGLLRAVGHHWLPLGWGVFLVLTMQLLEYHELLGQFESFVLDSWIGSSASSPERAPSKKDTTKNAAPILIVEIDEAAHRDCFGGHSPMSSQLLEKVVSSLVGTKDAPHPQVMGIDILTDAKTESYDSLRHLAWKASSSTRMIWAVPPERYNVTIPPFLDWLRNGEEDLVADAAPVLGKEPASINDVTRQEFLTPKFPANDPMGINQQAEKLEDQSGREIDWAMPLYPKDEDLRIRRFARQIFISNVGADVPTWPRKVAEVYFRQRAKAKAGVGARAADSQEAKGQFGSDFRQVIVSYNIDFLKIYKLKDLFTCQGSLPKIAIDWLPSKRQVYQDAVASDPIVLLGGTFELARDNYPTATGSTPGLLINAYALAAEMSETRGIGIREARRIILLILDVLAMLLTVCAFAYAGNVWIKLLYSAVAVATTYGLGYVAFTHSYIWVSCIGIALGFPLHLLLDLHSEADHHRKSG
jgi:CHASE2 domain-containing sensor protein